jgi:hypothetical protein
MTDEHWLVREAATMNRNATTRVMGVAARDPHPWVRDAAR